MILISHRGNIDGKNDSENNPKYIDQALNKNYDVEIDIWLIEGSFYLGHDTHQYSINLDWLLERRNRLWVHCKNIESIEYFNLNNIDLNYFWHDRDLMTLTSKGYMWAFPGNQPISGSIAVMPEIKNDDVSKCKGVCSDYIKNYKL